MGAGATTLIVSLGLIRTPITWCVMMASVTILSVEAWIANKILRRDVVFPYWRHGSWIDNKLKATAAAPAEESFATKLEIEMSNLSKDNLVQCFELCCKTQNEKGMQKLLRFVTDNRDSLSNDVIPFALRMTMNKDKLQDQPAASDVERLHTSVQI